MKPIIIKLKKPKIRRTWNINPKTKIKKSDKVYSRAKDKYKFIKELPDD